MVRDTHGLKIFRALCNRNFCELRQSDGLSAYHFILLFIVHQNPPFVWRNISCMVHKSNWKTSRRTVIRDILSQYSKWSFSCKNFKIYSWNGLNYKRKRSIVCFHGHTVRFYSGILSDFTLAYWHTVCSLVILYWGVNYNASYVHTN